MSTPESLARQRVSDVISQWRKGHSPDARSFLDQNPEVKTAQSLVVDLAYEEFCLRVEAGEQLDTDNFCGRFPTIQHSLARMLDVHRALNGQALGIANGTAWPEVGQRWLDWELVEPLGRGAFSRVFVALEPALGNRRVALKCSFAGPHEAFVLGSLSHEHIVPIHSSRFDEATGLTAISMPLLGRSTLASVLDVLAANGNGFRSASLIRAISASKPTMAAAAGGKGAPEYADSVVALFAKVAQGLAAAHRARVVHGDIKPSNILLTFAGEPMLMDFNLAGNDSGHGHIGGTPPYIAPECWQDLLTPPDKQQEAAAHDPSSDIFSLGAVMLEMLVGRLPFKVTLDSPESLPKEQDWLALLVRTSDGVARIEPPVQRLLARCLAFDPAHRYSDAGALSDDLSALLESKRRVKLWTRRLTVAAAASAALGGALGVWAWNYVAPNSRQGKFLRAKANLSQKEYGEAARLLGEVQKMGQPDAQIAAWTAYCLAMTNGHEKARPLFVWAVAQLPNHAELWNDLGYCCTHLERDSLGRDDAESHFDRAIRMNASLQAAYHNRGCLHLNAAISRGAGVPASAWNDLRTAMKIGPANGRLYFDAAMALSYDGKNTIDLSPDNFILYAMAGGVSPETFREPPFLLPESQIRQLQERSKALLQSIPSDSPLLLPPPFALQLN